MHTNITDAIQECGPGHPAHVTSAATGRTVAIRTGNEPDSWNLDFSDPQVDLRKEKGCGTIYNVPTKLEAGRLIRVFLGGTRIEFDGNPWFEQMINQAYRECEVIKLTPTRARVSYERPSGTTSTWRYQTTVGRYSYIGSY